MESDILLEDESVHILGSNIYMPGTLRVGDIQVNDAKRFLAAEIPQLRRELEELQRTMADLGMRLARLEGKGGNDLQEPTGELQGILSDLGSRLARLEGKGDRGLQASPSSIKQVR
jgi:hypothetical protein